MKETLGDVIFTCPGNSLIVVYMCAIYRRSHFNLQFSFKLTVVSGCATMPYQCLKDIFVDLNIEKLKNRLHHRII